MAEPVKIPTLLKRGRTYSFRRIVPAALRPLVNGKREIVRALNTRNEAEARVLAMQMAGETDAMFAALWTKLKKRSGPPLTPAQAAQVHAENLIEGATDWNLDAGEEGELVTESSRSTARKSGFLQAVARQHEQQ